MKRLYFKTSYGFYFVISLVVLICTVMYVFTEDHFKFSVIENEIYYCLFYVSIISTPITFLIMWRNRYYDDEIV